MLASSSHKDLIRVDEALLASVLSPYRDNCKYLKRATVELPAEAESPGFLVKASGVFEIPESCYIDDTGHLNAVEFNICYNQLLYTLLGQCVSSGLLPALGDMDLEEYKRRYLRDVLIHDMSSSFKRVINSDHFEGELEFVDAQPTERFVYIKSRCAFRDDNGGFARGKVSVAFVHDPASGSTNGVARSGPQA